MSPLLGVLGGGQLGRMLAMAAAQLGVRTRVFDKSLHACAGDVAEYIRGDFSDQSALARLCEGLDVATFEFENVPVAAAEFVRSRVPLFPGPMALEKAQDRLHERALLREVGFRTPEFVAVASAEEAARAAAEASLPAILKSRRFGYDGKGQAWIREAGEALQAWEAIGSRAAILDQAVSFAREVSLLVVRGRGGELKHYPPIENVHRAGILHSSSAPAAVDSGLLAEARGALERLVEALDYVGVLAVELFEVDGELLANEFAPRVHNSGHWTIEGAATSQFENHVRAVMGLPLGSTEAVGYAGMLNLIGDVRYKERLLGMPGAHVHFYGKQPRPGRKIGHVTVVAPNATERDAQLGELTEMVEAGHVEHAQKD